MARWCFGEYLDDEQCKDCDVIGECQASTYESDIEYIEDNYYNDIDETYET